jgi:hypothetical protein
VDVGLRENRLPPHQSMLLGLLRTLNTKMRRRIMLKASRVDLLPAIPAPAEFMSIESAQRGINLMRSELAAPVRLDRYRLRLNGVHARQAPLSSLIKLYCRRRIITDDLHIAELLPQFQQPLT